MTLFIKLLNDRPLTFKILVGGLWGVALTEKKTDLIMGKKL